jgi:hypothetical protein
MLPLRVPERLPGSAEKPSMQPITIIESDLAQPAHQDAIVRLINAYARDPMGNGHDLPEQVCAALIPGLQKHPTTLVFLA